MEATINKELVLKNREKVLTVFARLRKEGYLCKANHLCCQTCAGHDLTNRAVELVRKGKTVRGCIYWHNQDEDSIWTDGELCLAFGSMDSNEFGIIGDHSKEIGWRLVHELEKEGLKVLWNGSEAQRVCVLLKEEV